MMTIFSRSHTLALAPNSRLNTPMVPGPHTSWVMRTSTFTQTLSPGCTDFLPDARAMIFSVSGIGTSTPSPTEYTSNCARATSALHFEHVRNLGFSAFPGGPCGVQHGVGRGAAAHVLEGLA